MAKYESKDDRTGHPEGTIVELSEDELIKTPFNVFLTKIESIDEKKKLDDKKSDADKETFRKELSEKGLSNKRTELVLEQYPSRKDLSKNLKKLKFDDVTNEFLKKEYADLEFDLDGDGDFDKDDKSIAARALRRKIKK